jgi:hypothetical protein
MSWLFSQALVEEYSAGTSLAGEPCAQLNVMPTPHKFWRRGKTIDASDLSLFGLTLRLLTDAHGAELLMSYLADFRAKTSAAPERAPELTASEAGCGQKVRGLLAKWSPKGSCWKTAQCSLLGDSDEFSGTWPRWGFMRDGECWELEKPALLTSATASGSSLPTPSGVNGGTNNTMGRIDEWGGSSNPLRGTVIGSMCLPEFEELVMGWPIGWTELTPYATAKFHEWQQQHSISWPPLTRAAIKEAA